MYFLSKAITESGIKVVLSGEGADEILEVICILEMRLPQRNFKTIERVQKLFTADLLRADKSTMSQG
jgi:asparagine synthase (glutamine-hydrolysing)